MRLRTPFGGKKAQATGASPVPDDAPAVMARDVQVTYKTMTGQSVVALEEMSMTVGTREFTAIIGPSGCGKSTFLRAVGDLIPGNAVSGQLLVRGRSPMAARMNHEFAFVFQDPVLLPWRTVLQNVKLPLEVVPRALSSSAEELLELVGLKGFEHVLPRECSGGMRSRTSIARALMLDPAVLLMDEPFAAVDEITRDRLNLELLRIWSATDASVLFVTHSIPEAVFLADSVVVMSACPGRVIGTVDVPFERPRDLFLKKSVEFLRKTNEIRDLLEAEIIAAVSAGGLKAPEE